MGWRAGGRGVGRLGPLRSKSAGVNLKNYRKEVRREPGDGEASI